jgi:hypothetical protein
MNTELIDRKRAARVILLGSTGFTALVGTVGWILAAVA